MRNYWAISMILFAAACREVPDDRSVQPPAMPASDVLQRSLEFEVDELETATRNQFELILPNDAREVLETAEVLDPTIDRRRIGLTDPNLRHRLLLAIYRDAVASIESNEKWNAVNCVENSHTISASTTNKNQLIEKVYLSLSYHCGKLIVSGLLGDLPDEWSGRLELKRSESKKVFDEIARGE